MSKHTAGPWHFHEHGEDGYEIHPATHSRKIAVIIGDANDPFVKVRQETEANARLTAKAWLIPELVKALTKITRYYMQDSGYCEDRSEHTAVQAAMAIIAKVAEGE